MPNGKVYDPLIGQWMSPLWENVIERVATPTHLHLYRFNGNDPIDVRHIEERNQPTGTSDILFIKFLKTNVETKKIFRTHYLFFNLLFFL